MRVCFVKLTPLVDLVDDWASISVATLHKKLLFGFSLQNLLDGSARMNASKFGIVAKHFVGNLGGHTVFG